MEAAKSISPKKHLERMLINATQPDELRIATTKNGELIDLDIQYFGQKQTKSNIYNGIITSIEPSLEAVFVNYGKKRHGFLPLREISKEYFINPLTDKNQLATPINKLLQVNQEIVVQVEKEERGNKGAALTTFISLPGSFLVLMPNNPKATGISRRISGEEREQLKNTISQLKYPETMGLIVRTAGLGRSKEELQWDLNVLLHSWDRVKEKAVISSAPCLIYEESNIIIRAIRDYLREGIEEIIVDDEMAYNITKEYINQVRPEFENRIYLYRDPLPLFMHYQVEPQIQNAYQHEIRLPSGASLVFDLAEALTAIDVNSSRATKGANIEETARQINLESAEVIARQLRIRDIGGLIAIDFIDMPQAYHQEIETHLRNALRHDRARVQVGHISSEFGILLMSRQRLRNSLTKSGQVVCPLCNGQRSIRGIESYASFILYLIQKEASRSKLMHLQVQLPIHVATLLINEKRIELTNIETVFQAKISILPNPHLSESQHIIKKTKLNSPDELDHNQGISSYKIPKHTQEESSLKEHLLSTHANENISKKEALSTAFPPLIDTKHNQNLLKRFLSKFFGDTITVKQEKTQLKQPTVTEENTTIPKKNKTNTYQKQYHRPYNAQQSKQKKSPQRKKPANNKRPNQSNKKKQTNETVEKKNQ